MTILVWKIPSFLGNAFCTALVGFVLGREHTAYAFLIALKLKLVFPYNNVAIYPISLTLATKVRPTFTYTNPALTVVLKFQLLPVEIHMTALATMSSCAQMGSAICPFITGVLANAKGVSVLQPILLAVLSLMAGLWCLFPTRSI